MNSIYSMPPARSHRLAIQMTGAAAVPTRPIYADYDFKSASSYIKFGLDDRNSPAMHFKEVYEKLLQGIHIHKDPWLYSVLGRWCNKRIAFLWNLRREGKENLKMFDEDSLIRKNAHNAFLFADQKIPGYFPHVIEFTRLLIRKDLFTEAEALCARIAYLDEFYGTSALERAKHATITGHLYQSWYEHKCNEMEKEGIEGTVETEEMLRIAHACFVNAYEKSKDTRALQRLEETGFTLKQLLLETMNEDKAEESIKSQNDHYQDVVVGRLLARQPDAFPSYIRIDKMDNPLIREAIIKLRDKIKSLAPAEASKSLECHIP